MQYYSTLITLYRPYLSSQLVHQIDELVLDTDRSALFETTAGCVSAAHHAADMLRCYQRQHSLRRANIQIVHIIFTASLVFIHDICTQDSLGARRSRANLQLCCHALGEIGHIYGNATRALEVVILVKSEWERLSSGPARNAGLKRPSHGIHEPPWNGSSLDDGNLNKRRARNSFLSTGSDRPMASPKPSSTSAFQMLFDDYMEHSINMTMPSIGQDTWQTSAQMSSGLDNLTTPLSWPNHGPNNQEH